MTSFLVRKEMGRIQTQRRPSEDGGRDWSNAATSQGTPRSASSQQKLGERHGTILPQNFQKELTLLTP